MSNNAISIGPSGNAIDTTVNPSQIGGGALGGKAAETTGYTELGKKLDELRQHEAKYLDLLHDPDAKEQAKAPAELQAFHDSALQAAEMFWSVYIGQLDSRLKATEKDKVKDMVPGALGPPATIV